jgi:arylsulfatase A-like enzyme
MAGVEIPPDWDSQSMTPFLSGQSDQPNRTVVTASLHQTFGSTQKRSLTNWDVAFDGEYTLVRGFQNQKEQTWNTAQDPAEMEIDTTTPECQHHLEYLRKSLDNLNNQTNNSKE